nr:MAG TPA: hypothetical protein [Caudoviricetes sp.]
MLWYYLPVCYVIPSNYGSIKHLWEYQVIMGVPNIYI